MIVGGESTIIDYHAPFDQGFNYVVISRNMLLFKVWSEDKLNKKFVVEKKFAELVSTIALTCLGWGI